MKQSLVFWALTLALGALGWSQAEEGFELLFNGKDLTGWEGQEDSWKVENGAIVCTGEATEKNWLIWKGADLKDFELRLEYKFEKGNSGVQVRSKNLGDFQVQGYQVEVASPEKMGLWHHSLSPEPYRSHLATAGTEGVIKASGTKLQLRFAPEEEIQAVVKPDGEWNEMTIIAQGNSLTQMVNGTIMSELVDEDEKYAALAGILALQDHGKGCQVQFRKIRLKRL